MAFYSPTSLTSSTFHSSTKVMIPEFSEHFSLTCLPRSHAIRSLEMPVTVCSMYLNSVSLAQSSVFQNTFATTLCNISDWSLLWNYYSF